MKMRIRTDSRSKTALWLPTLLSLFRAAAMLAWMLCVGSVVDLSTDTQSNTCLWMATASLCAAAAHLGANFCAAQRTRNFMPAENRTDTLPDADDIPLLAEIVFYAAVGIGALIFMLRGSLGASVVVVLCAPLPAYVEAWIARRTRGYSASLSALRDRESALLRELPGNPKAPWRFDAMNDRQQTCARRALFATSLPAFAARFVRQFVLIAAATAAALGASLHGAAGVGQFVEFFCCACAILKICAAAPEIRARLSRADAEQTAAVSAPNGNRESDDCA